MNKEGLPLSEIITSVSTHDKKVVTDVVYNVVNKRRPSLSFFIKKKTKRKSIYSRST
jgi:hypothetical protein